MFTPAIQRALLTLVALVVAAYAMSQPGQFGFREVALAVAPTLLAWAHVSRPGDAKRAIETTAESVNEPKS